jgi:hypothetical protein
MKCCDLSDYVLPGDLLLPGTTSQDHAATDHPTQDQQEVRLPSAITETPARLVQKIIGTPKAAASPTS